MPNRSEGGEPPEELLEKTRKYHHKKTLSPREYEGLAKLGAALPKPADSDGQIFIIGSYEEPQKPRLVELVATITRFPDANYRAYLMEDLPGGLHPIVSFRLIADHSDHIVGVCEHDRGGFQLELGMVIVLTDYFDKSHILKKAYPDDMDYNQYNWMLQVGVFEMFDFEGRLWEWSEENYELICEEVLRSL